MKPLITRLALTLTTGTLVGTGFVLAKLLLNAGVSQAAVAFVQLIGAAAVMLAALGLRGGLPPRDRLHLRYFLGSALIGIAAGPLLGNWVLARIPAGVFTVLVTLSPMFTTLFNAALDRRWPALQALAGAALGLAGVLLVLVPRAQAVDAEQGLALLVAVGVPMLLAAANVYRSRRWPTGLPAPAATAGTLAVQAALLAPVFLATARDSGTASLLPLWPLLGALIAVTIASQLAGSFLQKLAGAAAYSQIGYVIALTGVAASALVFGEALGALFWPALVLVFTGIVLTNRTSSSSLRATPTGAALVR